MQILNSLVTVHHMCICIYVVFVFNAKKKPTYILYKLYVSNNILQLTMLMRVCEGMDSRTAL